MEENVKPKDEVAARQVKEQDVVASGEAPVELPEGPTHEEIRRRAYELHIECGSIHGQDSEDWLQAERELKAKYAACQVKLVCRPRIRSVSPSCRTIGAGWLIARQFHSSDAIPL